jgi:NADP-dependent 3-hydroxy acid dehydrogenase YdfG
VIVIGVTAGIAAATTRRLAQEGATLVLSGRSEERGLAIASELGATFVAGDLVAQGVPERVAGRPPQPADGHSSGAHRVPG